MTPTPRLLPCLLAVASLAGVAQAQSRRAPTVDDMLDLARLSPPRMSPDGGRVLYERADIRTWSDNKRVGSIWMLDTVSKETWRFLTHEKDSAPAWSPDGSLVAFLSTRDQKDGDKDADGAQLWIIRADGGEPRKLSTHKGGIERFEWSRDGARVFFLARDPQSDAEKAAGKAGDDAIYVDEGPNGQGRERWLNFWTIALADGAERQITRDGMAADGFSPSPDGRGLALALRRENRRNNDWRSEIARVDVDTGQMTLMTSNEAPERSPQWSPDGKWVSFLAPDSRTWELKQDKLWVLPAQGGTARMVSTTFTGNIRQCFWSPDSTSIVFAGTLRGRGGVWTVDLAGRLTTVSTGDWAADLGSISADGRHAALAIESPARAAEVAVVPLAGGDPTRLTEMNRAVNALEMPTFKAITWKSADGLEIEGFLWTPANAAAGQRLPLLLSIHGGPAGVFRTEFSERNSVLAGLGWAILEPNVRGSTSYGDAFLSGNVRDIGGGDYRDVITGVDLLVQQGIADPERLAVRGWSYGGILGGWTLTQTNRFKAASLGAMVTNWASEYAMGFNFDVVRWYVGGTPWDNPDGYRERSSYTFIDKVTTPTLLLHGEADTTCTIGQSMMFYQALKDRGVQARFIRFPREPHGFREPHHERIRDVEEIAWLMKHTLGKDWTPPVRPGTEDDTEKKSARPTAQ